MSNKVSAFLQTKKFGSPIKKAIMMYMADRASDDGKGIWVSKSNMAADLEMSIRTLQTNMRSLLKNCYIYEDGKKQCKNGYTVNYGICLECCLFLDSTRGEPHAVDIAIKKLEEQEPPQEMQGYPRSRCTPTPAADAPKPSIEPSKEPYTSSKDDEVNYYFDQLWEMYPRKVGKGQARKAYVTASKKIDFFDLLPKLEAYVSTLDGKDKQYMPHLATWLNGERWADEV